MLLLNKIINVINATSGIQKDAPIKLLLGIKNIVLHIKEADNNLKKMNSFLPHPKFETKNILPILFCGMNLKLQNLTRCTKMKGTKFYNRYS